MRGQQERGVKQRISGKMGGLTGLTGLQSQAEMQASTVASKWPIFPAARFLLVSAAINEELTRSGEPGVRAAAEQEERSYEY